MSYHLIEKTSINKITITASFHLKLRSLYDSKINIKWAVLDTSNYNLTWANLKKVLCKKNSLAWVKIGRKSTWHVLLFSAILIRGVSRTKFWGIYFFQIEQIIVFKKSSSSLFSFCKEENETVSHLYFYCLKVRNLWSQLKVYLAGIWRFHPKHWKLMFFDFPRKTIWKMLNPFFLFSNFTFIVLGKKGFWVLWAWWIR